MIVGGHEVRLVPNGIDRKVSGTARFLARVVNKSYFHVEVIGTENVPSPPFLISPVHRSNLDTILTASLTKHGLRYMGKDSLWKVGWAGKVFSALGGIPVNRDLADREAVDMCVSLLTHGQSLVLFPEGGRRDGLTVKDIHDGASFIALKAKVPIIPVGIAGSSDAWPKGTKFPRPKRCVMVIGKPLLESVTYDPAGKRIARSKIKELTSSLETELQRLLDEAVSRLE